MKNLNFLSRFFFLLLVSQLIISCAKTTKSKLANEWKVVNYEETTIDSVADNKGSTITIIDASDVKITSSHTVQGITNENVRNGKVNNHIFTIKKDGTWELTRSYYSDSPEGQGIVRRTDTYKASGYWNFLEKSKEDGYSNGERILFQTLKDEMAFSVKKIKSGHPDTLLNQEKTSKIYDAGSNSLVYIVENSTNKKLSLVSENSSNTTASYSGNSSYDTKKIKIELE